MFGGLGAYFGSTAINQGAGGLGAAPHYGAAAAKRALMMQRKRPRTPPGLQPASGIGSPETAEAPVFGGLPDGPLMAQFDGVLGRTAGTGYETTEDLAWGALPNGPLTAFKEGSLGMLDQCVQPVAGLGEYFNGGPGAGGPLMAYADGTVGGPPGGLVPGALMSFQDGSLGALGADGPALVLTPSTLEELKKVLNLLVMSYTFSNGASGWDASAQQAYVTWAEENTPGYPDKNVLFQRANGNIYPSARGVFVIMMDALQKWRASQGYETGELRWKDWYPNLSTFAAAFEAAGFSGSVVLPNGEVAPEASPGEPMPIVEAGLGTAVGAAAVAALVVGGIAFLISRQKGGIRPAQL